MLAGTLHPAHRSGDRRHRTDIGGAAGAVDNGKSFEKTMVFSRRIALAGLGLALALLGGCATTQVQTVAAAARLQRSADAFAVRVCPEPGAACRGNGHLPAARRFADQAHRFRKAVENDGDAQVVTAFKRLWLKYHALRDEVCRSRDRRLRTDLNPTSRAFVDVQILVENAYSYADPTVYAMGGYTIDPYYN